MDSFSSLLPLYTTPSTHPRTDRPEPAVSVSSILSFSSRGSEGVFSFGSMRQVLRRLARIEYCLTMNCRGV